MSRTQNVDFSLKDIVGISRRAGDGEGQVVFSPNYQGRRLHLAKPVLPARIGGDVGPVIQKQRGLNLGLARTGEKGVFVGPRIRIVAIGIGTGTDMTLPCRFEGREVGLELFELVDRIRPILPARFPERAQALFMSNRVLDDDGTDALRMGERHAESNGPTIVLHEQNIACDAEPCCEFIHHAREIVERVVEARRGGCAAMAEAGVIGGDEMILVGEKGQQRFPHPR